MTLYTYNCPKCGIYEEFREHNNRDLCECGQPVKQVFGGAFKLKGNGYYSNDSKRDDKLRKEAI